MHGVGGEGATLQEERATVPARGRDDRLFRDLLDRFALMAETTYRFSRDIYNQVRDPPEANLDRTIRKNLAIARRVFAERFLEILAVVYLRKSVAFDDLRKTLGGMSVSVLAAKLESLEVSGLVQRESQLDRPAQSRYSLTHKGMIIARLGEPIFQYLRMADGWSKDE